jgi:hypothetical protein
MIDEKTKRFINEIMKRRLTYNGKRVYIKSLGTKRALVSYYKENDYKMFKVDVKDLADFK